MSCKSCGKKTRNHFCKDCWNKVPLSMQDAMLSTVGAVYKTNKEIQGILIQEAVDHLQLRRLLLEARGYVEAWLTENEEQLETDCFQAKLFREQCIAEALKLKNKINEVLQ
jgi:hypothetical protein